ncbi:hypothetical protein SAMN04487948_11937 [Halogranum amylolyticum]|uniref:Uncharacterized protein n=1 Tax=Halogranum amylolyticum TaxID=660520 RepID=A0A1H8VT23_9EURY|nr:hypothetical protein SAMN04487948_11937 [Halogranum amylolyticum]
MTEYHDHDKSGQSNIRGTLSRRRLLQTAVAGGLLGIGVSGPLTEPAAASSRTGPKPGPNVLYEPPATAPQFENSPPWRAEPLLVAGTEGYSKGEYQYQDYVYDDYGANTTETAEPPQPAPNDASAYGDNGVMSGDVVYPTDAETYRHNAADLLEFRATTEGDSLRYRVTLNTMTQSGIAAAAIGIDTGGTTGTDEWGYGLGTLGDLSLDHVVVTWGDGAELDGEPVDSQADLARNQIDVMVPLTPDEETWRHYLVVGLFDPAKKSFVPVQELPDETHPGGAHESSPPPVFNVGFRFDEPVGAPNIDRETGEEQLEEATETGSRGIGYGHWRDHAQATALAARDISEFYADIDFAKVKTNVEERRLPETGFQTRLYSSHYDIGSGVDAENDILRGRVQQYGLYVPKSYDSETPTPIHLHLHSLGSTYSEYATLSPNLLRQLGEQRDSLILTPHGRGPAGWYLNEAELDVFEAWGDVRSRYTIDSDHVTLGGYSMGAFGTFRLGGQYPDLFARAFAVSGGAFEAESYEGSTPQYLDGFRNLPLRMWNGGADKLVPAPVFTATEERLRELGYRHELGVFPEYDHFTFAFRDEWGPARDFLGDATVPMHPTRVVYPLVPEYDAEQFGLVHDGAYWVSDATVAADAQSGRIDARSRAFGEAPPIEADYEREGTEPTPHVKRGTVWKDPIANPPAENALDLTLDGVSEVTVWVEDAGIDPSQAVRVTVDSTHSVEVTLATANKRTVVSFEAGESEKEATI